MFSLVVSCTADLVNSASVRVDSVNTRFNKFEFWSTVVNSVSKRKSKSVNAVQQNDTKIRLNF
ncbi:hypothetical protein HanRHA438_Chr02g0082421 [Helianthus annuus]|nr:hypothetical protein HanRHA438_Chr02g0082421 [Helianthus annuus]KAJ0952149.1 hypothetical protein HanPSC8_Chr02g0068721 [Helianthus annuus]